MPGTGAGEIEAQRGSDITASWSSERWRHKEADIINRAWRGQRAASSIPGSEKVPEVDTHGVRRCEQGEG